MSQATTEVTDKILDAANEYVRRQDRASHPDGTFDKSGRWYPSDAETCPCCSDICSPSLSYPYSFMVHCRTIKHVAMLFDAPLKDVRAKARMLDKEQEN